MTPALWVFWPQSALEHRLLDPKSTVHVLHLKQCHPGRERIVLHSAFYGNQKNSCCTICVWRLKKLLPSGTIVLSYSPVKEHSISFMLIHPQAIVLMSLANGKSSIKMPRLTNQAKAAMLAVETFTEVKQVWQSSVHGNSSTLYSYKCPNSPQNIELLPYRQLMRIYKGIN